MDSSKMPLVVALGGHAISWPNEEGNIEQQFQHARQTAAAIAGILDPQQAVILTHGNGPQVGNILRRVELAAGEVYPIPLELCVADTQGGMGYMIAQCMNNELARRGVGRSFSTLITTVEVAGDDPAFLRPEKPIGPCYPADRAAQFQSQRGWSLQESTKGFRRVVPSPLPRAIVEIELIRRLAAEREWFIAGGGGGIPVVRDANGACAGVEAVVDKDHTTLLIAEAVGAAAVVIVTSVPEVMLDYGRPTQRRVARLRAAEVRQHLAAGQFPAGSMGPKMEAAAAFVERSPHGAARAIICDVANIGEATAGRAGTWITK